MFCLIRYLVLRIGCETRRTNDAGDAQSMRCRVGYESELSDEAIKWQYRDRFTCTDIALMVVQYQHTVGL